MATPAVLLALAATARRDALPAPPSPSPANGAVPSYTVHRTTGPIHIDGRLDEADWQHAGRVSPFRTWDDKPFSDDTEVKALWDDQRLYVAFRCRDSHIVAGKSERDDPIYSTDDVVEMFMDPEGTLKRYTEVIVSARNVVFDAYQITNAAGDAPDLMFRDWDAKRMQTAVHVEGRLKTPGEAAGAPDLQWTAEVAIPYDTWIKTQHSPPRDGDVWRAALTRYNRPNDQTPEWHTAWSPPFKQGWPHIVARFGRLVFSSRPVGG